MNCKKWLLICFWFLCLPMAAQNYLTESTDIEETLSDFTSAINNLYDNPSRLNDAINSTGKHFGHSEYFYYNGELISSFTKWLNTYNRTVLKGRYIEHTLEVQSKTFEKVNPNKKEDKTFKVSARLLREDDHGNIYSDDVTFTILWKGNGQHDKITKIEGDWIRELTPEKRKIKQSSETVSRTTEVTNTSTDDEEDDGWAWWQILLAVLIGIPVLLYLIGFLKAVYDAINEKQTAIKNKEEELSDISDAEVQTSRQVHVDERVDSTHATLNRGESDSSSVKSQKESANTENRKTQQSEPQRPEPQQSNVQQPPKVQPQPASAMKEDAQSLYEKGMRILRSNSYKNNGKNIFELFTKAHKLGYPEATYMLGYCYYHGIGTSVNKERALEYFQEANKDGLVPYAAYALGEELRERGEHLIAFRWYKKALEQGVLEARLPLAEYYESGQGGWKNNDKAFQLYNDAGAYNGNKDAEYHLGRCYYEGIGTVKNLPKALAHWKSAEAKGQTDASYRLGLHYCQTAEKPENFKRISDFLKTAAGRFKKAADAGHTEAQYRLGECYYSGQGVPLNYNEAYKYYKLAAEKNHTDAIFKQAIILYKGMGSIRKDVRTAISLWKKAAECGHAEAMYNLAQHYENEASNPNSLCKAKDYYESAINLGHEKSLEALMALENRQTGKQKADKQVDGQQQKPESPAKPAKDTQKPASFSLTKNEQVKSQYNQAMADFDAQKYDKALQKFRQLADEGFANAAYMTGLCYAKGHGTSIDLKQAAVFMRKAADKNHTEAQFQYGMMLYQVKGLAINNLNASNYFKKAAIKQHPEAMYMLAQCYEYGIKGAEKSYKEAAKWYEKAIRKGWTPAKDALMRVKDRMH